VNRTGPSVLRVAMTVEQLWQRVPGGSGTYIRELVGALPDDVQITGVAARHGEPQPGEPLGVPVALSRLPRRALYDGWNLLRRPRVPRPAASADVLHASTWAVPPRSAPLVVTVHDVAFLRAPEHFTPRGNRYFRRALEVVRRDADLVIAPSHATADDCVAAGVDPARLRVVPHGVRVPPNVGTPERAADLRGTHRPYVLWCGTLEPRKNVAGLLRAFAMLASAEPDLDLVVVGPAGWGDTADEVRGLMTGAIRDRVRMLGHVSWIDLHTLYAHARAFCFPSIWEGFGMPVLEAMAHGVPTVSSAGTSMAEFAEGAGLLVDPHDPASLAEALRHAVGSGHDELATLARARAAEYTWQRAAAATALVYREALGRA
jgi:glycosyltransferase involved in cell wall biosynthesis